MNVSKTMRLVVLSALLMPTGLWGGDDDREKELDKAAQEISAKKIQIGFNVIAACVAASAEFDWPAGWMKTKYGFLAVNHIFNMPKHDDAFNGFANLICFVGTTLVASGYNPEFLTPKRAAVFSEAIIFWNAWARFSEIEKLKDSEYSEID